MSRELDFPALSYPGPLIAASGLLRAGFFHALTGDAESPVADLRLPGFAGASLRTLLQQDGCADFERRTVVLATGSNASPGVMHRKLSRAGVRATLPFVQCEVRGLAVGHSAHISAGGYIAAAPYADPTARTATVASWLDDEQLNALDLTEPNYRRVRLPDKLFPVTLILGADPDPVEIYQSRFGVLQRDGQVIPLGRQEALHDLIGTELDISAPEAVVEALTDTRTAQRISRFLQTRYAVRSGLTD